MKFSHVHLRNSLMRGKLIKNRVRRKQIRGVMSGRTAKDVSPTSPRVTLSKASALTGKPSFGATISKR
jgi:hypothetical protein